MNLNTDWSEQTTVVKICYHSRIRIAMVTHSSEIQNSIWTLILNMSKKLTGCKLQSNSIFVQTAWLLFHQWFCQASTNNAVKKQTLPVGFRQQGLLKPSTHGETIPLFLWAHHCLSEEGKRLHSCFCYQVSKVHGSQWVEGRITTFIKNHY